MLTYCGYNGYEIVIIDFYHIRFRFSSFSEIENNHIKRLINQHIEE